MKYTRILLILVISSVIGSQLFHFASDQTRNPKSIISFRIQTTGNQNEFVVDTLLGHKSEVWDIDFSPDGTLLASASSDKSILVWNTSTGQLLHNLTGHLDSVYSVVFHPKEPILASGSFDKSIKLWNLTTGDIMYNLTGHTSSVWALEFNHDGSYIISGSSDATVRVWDYKSTNSLYNLTGHSDAVRALTILPNGILASGSFDKSILLWNITTGNLESILANTTDKVLSMNINPQNTHLVSGSQDNRIDFWDLDNIGAKTRPGQFVNSWVRSLTYDSHGYYLASGLENGNISIWNDVTDSLVINLTGHSLSVRSVAFHPYQPLLASASGDKTIRIWNVSDLDNDQMHDSWEIENGLSPSNKNDGDFDLDSDGLSNYLEYQFGTNPQSVDSDQDQIIDSYEYFNGLNGSLNDADMDKDQDGIPNLYEFLNGLNADLDDSNEDSDADGLPNLYEYENGLRANTDDSSEDFDNDGLPNLYEYRYSFIIGVNDGGDDSDSDGLTNLEEYLLGTNPRDTDSDNDNFSDHFENNFGTDPLIFFSNPVTLIIGLVLLFSLFLLLTSVFVRNFTSIKNKTLSIGGNAKAKAVETVNYLRLKSSQTWLQDIEAGKAIDVKTLSATLETSQLKLPRLMKTKITSKRLTGKALVLRSDMLLLKSVPPKEVSCQVCIGEITDSHYFQCESCKRFVCIHDYVDLKKVESTMCPNCSEVLVLFPFSCKACGLDYSTVTETAGKSGCTLCGYTLIDQSSLISEITEGIVPSKLTKTILDLKKHETKDFKESKK